MFDIKQRVGVHQVDGEIIMGTIFGFDKKPKKAKVYAVKLDSGINIEATTSNLLTEDEARHVISSRAASEIRQEAMRAREIVDQLALTLFPAHAETRESSMSRLSRSAAWTPMSPPTFPVARDINMRELAVVCEQADRSQELDHLARRLAYIAAWALTKLGDGAVRDAEEWLRNNHPSFTK